MEKDLFRKEYCPIIKAMDEIGDKWCMLIMRECFLGSTRFDEFQKHLGVSKSVLSSKLKKMVEQGLLKKVPYQKEGERTRHEYRLTAKSRDFRKVLIGLLNWGNAYLVKDGEETMYIVDEYNKPVTIKVVDGSSKPIHYRDTKMVIRPKV